MVAPKYSPLTLAIRLLRLRLGETQTVFASRIGVSVSTLAHYEIGAQVPKSSILKILIELAEKEGFIEGQLALHDAFTGRVEQLSVTERTGNVRDTLKAVRELTQRTAAENSARLRSLMHNAESNPSDVSELKHFQKVLEEDLVLFKTLEGRARNLHRLATNIEKKDPNDRHNHENKA